MGVLRREVRCSSDILGNVLPHEVRMGGGGQSMAGGWLGPQPLPLKQGHSELGRERAEMN